MKPIAEMSPAEAMAALRKSVGLRKAAEPMVVERFPVFEPPKPTTIPKAQRAAKRRRIKDPWAEVSPGFLVPDGWGWRFLSVPSATPFANDLTPGAVLIYRERLSSWRTGDVVEPWSITEPPTHRLGYGIPEEWALQILRAAGVAWVKEGDNYYPPSEGPDEWYLTP